MNLFIILIFQIFAAAILSVLINFFGSASRKFGYVNFSNIQAEGLLGYNLIFRVLAPSVYIAFISIFLYFIGADKLVENIWLIALWYALLSILMLISLGRFPLVNKFLYFSIHLVAIVITYLLYKVSFSHGLGAILPDASDFRTELWVIFLIFFYSLFNNYEPDPSSYYERKDKLSKNLYGELTKCYDKFLSDDIKNNPFLEKLFFSIMIIEVINRNRFLRFLEKILYPLGLIKTTGIMQIKSDRLLSDEESIHIAQRKIIDLYKSYKNTSQGNYGLASKIIENYNGGRSYLDAVTEVYSSIDSRDLLYKKRQMLPATTADLDIQSIEAIKKSTKELLADLKKFGVDINDIMPD